MNLSSFIFISHRSMAFRIVKEWQKKVEIHLTWEVIKHNNSIFFLIYFIFYRVGKVEYFSHFRFARWNINEMEKMCPQCLARAMMQRHHIRLTQHEVMKFILLNFLLNCWKVSQLLSNLSGTLSYPRFDCWITSFLGLKKHHWGGRIMIKRKMHRVSEFWVWKVLLLLNVCEKSYYYNFAHRKKLNFEGFCDTQEVNCYRIICGFNLHKFSCTSSKAFHAQQPMSPVKQNYGIIIKFTWLFVDMENHKQQKFFVLDCFKCWMHKFIICSYATLFCIS